MANLVNDVTPYNKKGELQAIIDLPSGSQNKYEYDHDLGCVVLDRVLPVAMAYPCEYGFIPQTLADDGDPVDVLVYATFPTIPGCIMKVRPIGYLETEDEAGIDPKIICVPSDKTDPRWSHIKDVADLGEHRMKELKMFFKEYKKLEPEKYEKIKIGKVGTKAEAEAIIEEGIKNFKPH